MKKRSGITLVELLVVLAIIALLLALLWPAPKQVKRIAQRVVCGTNLLGIGRAVTVYANDFNSCYPQLPGNGPWGKELGFDYYNAKPDFAGAQANTPRTVSASLYLLIRLADVSPKSFVCMESDLIEYSGINPRNLNFEDLWDFGSDPYKHVSYAYHNPYGKYPVHNKRPESFAIFADMSPWFKEGDILRPNEKKDLAPQIISLQDKTTWEKGDSLNHSIYEKKKIFFYQVTRRVDCGIGQNVLRVDGHTSFEKTPNVGINRDNIYTYWSTEENPGEQDIQGGTAPTSRSPENDAKSEEDSFLVI